MDNHAVIYDNKYAIRYLLDKCIVDIVDMFDRNSSGWKTDDEEILAMLTQI